MLTGDRTFQIGGLVVFPDGTAARLHFPISELEFPLDVALGTVEGRYGFDDPWSIGVGLSKNLTTDAGTTKDSDWGYLFVAGVPGFGPTSLDVYSESDTELEAFGANVDLRCRLLTRGCWEVGVAVGYLHQTLDFEVRNLREEYPSLGGLIPPQHVGGKVAEYDTSTSMPYVEGLFAIRLSPSLKLECGLGGAPFVRTEDEGRWLLRDQTFDSTMDGAALLAHAKLLLGLRDGWFAAATATGMALSADGEMARYEHGALLGRIDQEVDSSQVSATLSAGRVF
jgi:hypothetical protein